MVCVVFVYRGDAKAQNADYQYIAELLLFFVNIWICVCYKTL